MLDRICGELTRSADSIADQQLRISGRNNPHGKLDIADTWVTIPVIVTNARLHVCRFDPASVPLDAGALPDGTAMWEVVDQTRYRKAFDALEALTGFETLTDLERAVQRTIIIINATALVDWLRDFNLEPASYGG